MTGTWEGIFLGTEDAHKASKGRSEACAKERVPETSRAEKNSAVGNATGHPSESHGKPQQRQSQRKAVFFKEVAVPIPRKALSSIESLWGTILVNVECFPLSVLLCGASSGAGASTTGLYLAFYSALKQGNRTVYLDLDVDKKRKPFVHNEAVGDVGFAGYCLENTPLSSMLVRTTYENLSIIPSGIPRGMPLSAVVSRKDRVKAFFNELKEHFDVVIVDGAPVLTNPGIVSVALYVDQVLLVCRYSHTRYEVAGLAVRRLEEAGVKRIGGVLTCREYPVPSIVYRLLK